MISKPIEIPGLDIDNIPRATEHIMAAVTDPRGVFGMDEQKRDEQYLAAQLASFRQRWKPKDRHSERDFEVELYAMIHLAQRVARGPLVKHMAAALSLAPPPPIMIVGTPLKGGDEP